MAPFDRNTPLDARELDHINDHLDSDEFIILSLNLCIGTPSEYVAMQLMENADAPREMLNTWHSNQDPAKERRLLVKALNESSLCSLAETVRMGKCRRKLQQGMSTDQHHATGKAVVSNLNTGMALFNPNTPLDDLELKSISKQPGPQELLKLSTSSETIVKLARQLEKAGAPSEMLIARHPLQDHAKKARLMINSLIACLDSLAEKDQMGGWHALQLSSAQHPSHPRKRTHTQTLAGHEPQTNTLDARQPSSAFYPSRPKVRTVANPPQQPDIVPMRITSYEITEIKLRDVSKELGAEWRMVGTYLGFKNSQIEVMQEQYPVVKECIFQMLLKWRNTNGVKATKKKLKETLQRSQREDLADFIDEADD